MRWAGFEWLEIGIGLGRIGNNGMQQNWIGLDCFGLDEMDLDGFGGDRAAWWF